MHARVIVNGSLAFDQAHGSMLTKSCRNQNLILQTPCYCVTYVNVADERNSSIWHLLFYMLESFPIHASSWSPSGESETQTQNSLRLMAWPQNDIIIVLMRRWNRWDTLPSPPPPSSASLSPLPAQPRAPSSPTSDHASACTGAYVYDFVLGCGNYAHIRVLFVQLHQRKCTGTFRMYWKTALSHVR